MGPQKGGPALQKLPTPRAKRERKRQRKQGICKGKNCRSRFFDRGSEGNCQSSEAVPEGRTQYQDRAKKTKMEKKFEAANAGCQSIPEVINTWEEEKGRSKKKHLGELGARV